MRALIYTRQSTDDQDTTQASQTYDCKQWAENNGYEIAGIFHDETSGATPACNRVGFRSLLSNIMPNDVIISKRRDRLGRDLIENALAERAINDRGARFTTTSNIDTTTAIGIVSNQIEDVFAGYERALIKQRTKTALEELRRQGKPSGTPKLGTRIIYTNTIKDNALTTVAELALDTDEQDKINTVREWRSKGASFREIQERCKEHNLRSRRDCIPSIRTLHYWCDGIDKPKSKPTTKTEPVPKRRIESRPENKGLVALVISLKEQGMSLRSIASKVSNEGYTTSKGNPITKTQVIRILNNA